MSVWLRRRGSHENSAPDGAVVTSASRNPPSLLVAPSRQAAARGTHDLVFHLLQCLTPRGRVLDVPCGSGALTKRMLEAGYKVTGVDIEVQPAIPNLAFRQTDMNEPLPFAHESFDAIVSVEGIEHIRRPWDFIAECARVLRPKGLLIVSTPNTSSLRSRWRWLLTGFHNKCKYPLDKSHPQWRHHVNMMSFPELRYMLHTSGFTIEEVRTNRVKPVSWLCVPLMPVQWLAAKMVLPRGVRSKAHRKIIEDVRCAMLRPAVLYGESLIITARLNLAAS